MIHWWWSIVLPAIGLLSTYLIGNKKKSGWLIAVLNNIMWITYAIVTMQLGFIVSCLFFLVIGIRNYIKWEKEE